MKTVKIEMEMPKPPKGYEYTGEYRSAKKGEIAMGEFDHLNGPTVSSFPIIRKKTKKKWKPETGDLYWWVAAIDCCPSVCGCAWADDETDADCMKIGNCFKTEEEAEQMLDKILKVLKKGL